MLAASEAPKRAGARGQLFSAVRISLASPDVIRSRSHRKVTSPDTLDLRTLRTKPDGLFCERIFGLDTQEDAEEQLFLSAKEGGP